ncbi:phosphonate ABC transporter, permease protein PhnE [Weissella diestrammenae]|uniref:Phosphonate ABC transporter, permease protein PhnE n=2 Tax=Weissella diestrammenae TaxID=1162633 RepID=A0A7G9T701_9LACO|nr:phosphonate ABC transporter, permease protein PhnE [Weissella diestrammenae]MCM0582527.1 phosphonate ABC transporter, permease protein PhnE [Weissella diestrammenae]QNN75876.1 phosphonate ABC transporter, permease protein PhnE [Weissella diestrammenae]
MTSLPSRTFSARWHVKPLLLVVLIVLIMIGSAVNTQVTAEFSWDQFINIIQKMVRPDWSYIPTIIQPMLQTLQMAIVGTVVGALLALPFSVLAARNLIKQRWVRGGIRFFLNLIRALPDLLLGALFVAVVGIGPMAGVGALSVFSFGMVSKLFYEAIETIDEGPLDALKAAGANGAQIILFAVIPQVFNQFLSYFLYTLEINVRASTILGYLGAGGVGLYLSQTMSMFRYDRTIIVILMILAVVIVVDGISNRAREALA